MNDTAATEIYTLSLHDALPIYVILLRFALHHDDHGLTSNSRPRGRSDRSGHQKSRGSFPSAFAARRSLSALLPASRSEEHTSELQSRQYIVCRLLLEKKKRHSF